jgi:PTS system mannose-specific IIA component
MAADGSSSPHPTAGGRSDTTAKCGVVLIGHGRTATALLEAARAIIPGEGLADVIAVDAGIGQTPELRAKVCAAIEQVDEGRGVLLLADLMGSSPCMCGINESAGLVEHGIAVVSGLNLAMLTKLAIADRRSSPRELAEACADSAGRSISVKVNDAQTACKAGK